MRSEVARKDLAVEEGPLKQTARTPGNAMSLTKPMLGLAVGGTLGLLDGLSGFLEPSLAPVMTGVITSSLLKGVVAGVVIGYVSQKLRSMALGLLAGAAIGALFSLLVILWAGMALFWDIMLPGMLLGVIVGFSTQKFGTQVAAPPVTR
jgi:hypothetical protein